MANQVIKKRRQRYRSGNKKGGERIKKDSLLENVDGRKGGCKDGGTNGRKERQDQKGDKQVKKSSDERRVTEKQ